VVSSATVVSGAAVVSAAVVASVAAAVSSTASALQLIPEKAMEITKAARSLS